MIDENFRDKTIILGKKLTPFLEGERIEVVLNVACVLIATAMSKMPENDTKRCVSEVIRLIQLYREET